MSGLGTFTDEDLTAFLDGELDPERLRAITGALSNDKSLRARVDTLSIPTGDIKAAFETLTLGAPPYPSSLENHGPQRRGFGGYLPALAATAVLCLATGWFAASLYLRDMSAGWQQSVATYHALYVNSTLADVNQTPAAAAAELTRVSGIIGKPIALNAVMASQTLDYKRAQVLGFEGRPLIQLAFLSKTGIPVALCIIKDGKSDNSGVKTGLLRGMATASWSKGEYDYLLIGGAAPTVISEAAALFSARL
jgi:anti-sigma factor RsiW